MACSSCGKRYGPVRPTYNAVKPAQIITRSPPKLNIKSVQQPIKTPGPFRSL